MIFWRWDPFEMLGDASSDNLTSVKWNRHCARVGGRTILGKFYGRKVLRVFPKHFFWNFYPVYVWHGPITPFLLSTIYYPPDQLYGPHCWSWEGGKTQHLPSFLEMGRNNFLEFIRSHVALFVVILLQHCGISKCKELLADLTKTTSIIMADGRILHGTWKDRL